MAKLLSPWGEGGDAWDRIRIAGVLFEGKVEVEGTPWKKKHDTRRRRGHNGARRVATGWDLGEWTITLFAFDDATDAQLAELVDAVTGGAPATQDSSCLAIEHPAIAVNGVTQVTLEEADTPTPSGPGALLVWKIKVKEYRAPEPITPRVAAPAAQTADAPDAGRSRFGVEEEFVPRRPAPPTADP